MRRCCRKVATALSFLILSRDWHIEDNPVSKRRVVVTGLGIISPVGNSVDQAWQAIVAGKSGVGPITQFDASNYPTRIAAEVKNFDPAQRSEEHTSELQSPKEL